MGLRVHTRESVKRPIRIMDPKTVNRNAERFFRMVMSESTMPLTINPGGGIPGNYEIGKKENRKPTS